MNRSSPGGEFGAFYSFIWPMYAFWVLSPVLSKAGDLCQTSFCPHKIPYLGGRLIQTLGINGS